MGAGKTYFLNRLALELERLAIIYQRISAGDAIRTDLKRKGIEPTRDALHERSWELRKSMSDAQFVEWLRENTPQIDWHRGLILIDGIREPGNHSGLQELYPGRNVLVYLHTAEELRLKRVAERDNITFEDAARHFSDNIEGNYSAYFLKNADYVVAEEKDLEEAINSLVSLIRKL